MIEYGSGIAARIKVASEFLSAINRGEECVEVFQTFDDSPKKNPDLARILIGSLGQHFSELFELNERGAGVFYTVAKTDGKGRRTENVVAPRAWFADYDGEGRSPMLRPTIVVKSGRGYHAYWLASRGRPEDIERINAAIAFSLDTDPKVKDRARVMRLPGFHHMKDPTRPRPVKWRQLHYGAYSPGEMLDWLVEPPPKPAIERPASALPEDATGLAERARAYVSVLPASVSGNGGHQALWKAAVACVRGFGITGSDAIGIIVECFNNRCEPPWGQIDIEHKVKSAETRADLPWGYLASA